MNYKKKNGVVWYIFKDKHQNLRSIAQFRGEKRNHSGVKLKLIQLKHHLDYIPVNYVHFYNHGARDDRSFLLLQQRQNTNNHLLHAIMATTPLSELYYTRRADRSYAKRVGVYFKERSENIIKAPKVCSHLVYQIHLKKLFYLKRGI